MGPVPRGSQSPGEQWGWPPAPHHHHHHGGREIRGDAKQQRGTGELPAGFASSQCTWKTKANKAKGEGMRWGHTAGGSQGAQGGVRQPPPPHAWAARRAQGNRGSRPRCRMGSPGFNNIISGGKRAPRYPSTAPRPQAPERCPIQLRGSVGQSGKGENPLP